MDRIHMQRSRCWLSANLKPPSFRYVLYTFERLVFLKQKTNNVAPQEVNLFKLHMNTVYLKRTEVVKKEITHTHFCFLFNLLKLLLGGMAFQNRTFGDNWNSLFHRSDALHNVTAVNGKVNTLTVRINSIQPSHNITAGPCILSAGELLFTSPTRDITHQVNLASTLFCMPDVSHGIDCHTLSCYLLVSEI